MLLSLTFYVNLSIMIFTIGVIGVIINRESILSMMLSIEIMLLAINVNFIAFSVFLNDINGQIFSIYILTVAAAESAIGLAILVAFFRITNSIEINTIHLLKG